MRVLFVCNQNQNRSKTAEEIFCNQFETRSAGLFNMKPITENEINWADVVIVMEDFQRSELARRFPKLYMQKRILSLDVPDRFQYQQKELVELLRKRIKYLF
jgi:predicted protein tyrosine phosphatase